MIVEKTAHQNELAVLKEAFQRFSSTGRMLQERYDELKVEVHQLRAALKQKEAEVKRHERLAVLGRTAAAIAHEIRNPLGALKLFLSMLQEDSTSPESVKIMDQMHKSIERLDSTVANILQFAKDKRLEYAPVNLPSLIMEQVEYFRASEPGTLKFELNLDGPLFVNGDEEALRRVFYNLFLNAAQAMKRNGFIRISTVDTGEGAEILVKDTGPGIDAAVRETLFEPFVTARSAGTGLGLAIVRQIVEQHGGSVGVGRDSDVGAEFVICLPHKAAQC